MCVVGVVPSVVVGVCSSLCSCRRAVGVILCLVVSVVLCLVVVVVLCVVVGVQYV